MTADVFMYSFCGASEFDVMQEFFNIPLEHTPDPQPTVYVSEFLSFGGLGIPGVCSKSWLIRGTNLGDSIQHF